MDHTQWSVFEHVWRYFQNSIIYIHPRSSKVRWIKKPKAGSPLVHSKVTVEYHCNSESKHTNMDLLASIGRIVNVEHERLSGKAVSLFCNCTFTCGINVSLLQKSLGGLELYPTKACKNNSFCIVDRVLFSWNIASPTGKAHDWCLELNQDVMN